MDLKNYLEAAKNFLRCGEPIIYERPFGLVVVKGNYTPSEALHHIEFRDGSPPGIRLNLSGRTLHERALIMFGETGMKQHPETDNEVAVNFGDINVCCSYPNLRSIISKGQMTRTIFGDTGHVHGFSPEPKDEERVGMLYIAKLLKPGYANADGRTFRVE